MGDDQTFEDCAHCGWPVVIQRYFLSGGGNMAEAECGGCSYTVRLEGVAPMADRLLAQWNQHMRDVRRNHAEPSAS